MSNDAGLWEVRLGLYATEQQAEEVVDQITRLLCPDPHHAPPCPIPWSVALLHEPDLDSGAHTELVEQAHAEHEQKS